MQVEERCRIVEKTCPNGHAVRLVVEVGDMVKSSFQGPGQFVHVKCGEARLLRRPISVCTCQSEVGKDLLSLVFEVRGSGTDWLAQREVGEELDILGLLGNGFTMEPEGRYLLVGGGIGVPPMLGCGQYAAGRCDAVIGFRDAAHALLKEELEACCGSVTVCTEDDSLGERGFVTGPVERLLGENRYTAILCCGPKPMLKAVAALAARYGVPCQVSLEERMACGVGACLGCAVALTDGSMKHVCKDGPIFSAEEVVWDD